MDARELAQICAELRAAAVELDVASGTDRLFYGQDLYLRVSPDGLRAMARRLDASGRRLLNLIPETPVRINLPPAPDLPPVD